MRPLLALSCCFVLLAGCDLFTPRDPEAPSMGSSTTFEQPETPERVIANIEAAMAALNVENYSRSLAQDFTFTPASSAEGAYPWVGWSHADEENYLRVLAGAARPEAAHRLLLADRTLEFAGATRALLDTDYTLVVHHLRPEVPDTLTGHLVWTIVQGADGLWRLQHWTDRGAAPTWSTLKAAFAQ